MTPASGRQDHTTSPSASAPFVKGAIRVHRIPARELLRDEAVRFAERARAAGVDVELELWHGMQHCFQILQFLPESGRAIASIARFVTRCTGWSPAVAVVPASAPMLAPID